MVDTHLQSTSFLTVEYCSTYKRSDELIGASIGLEDLQEEASSSNPPYSFSPISPEELLVVGESLLESWGDTWSSADEWEEYRFADWNFDIIDNDVEVPYYLGSTSPSVDSDVAALPSTIEKELESSDHHDKAAISQPTPGSFWKYRTQPKGPKVATLNLKLNSKVDGHKALIVSDPAIDKTIAPEYERNFTNGKYRVGEGNDLTPNPRKLARLGKSLKQVQATMERFKETGSEPEKKKKKTLISKQCRLKKCANHEANKIIFDGLDKERDELSRIIRTLKTEISENDSSESFTSRHQELVKDYHTKVAGRTEDYVNDILEVEEKTGDE